MTLNKRNIIGVCTGNSGRSPVFELVGNNHLIQRGLSDRFYVASAGTLVDVIKSGEYSLESMKRFIELARHRGDIYTPFQEARMDEAVATNDLKTARRLFKHLVDTFHAEEVSHRTAAMRHFGVRDNGRYEYEMQTPIQFYPVFRWTGNEPVAIITMDQRNKDVVLGHYPKNDCFPKPTYIEVLNQVPGNIGKPLNADAFGKTRDDYFRVFEQIMQQTPVAIDYLLGNVAR